MLQFSCNACYAAINQLPFQLCKMYLTTSIDPSNYIIKRVMNDFGAKMTETGPLAITFKKLGWSFYFKEAWN